MRKLLLLLLLLHAPLASAQAPAPSPLILPADSPDLHLLKQTELVYPAIAKAAHVSGQVTLAVDIGPDGKVRGIKTISGPPMLTYAAVDCVKQWIYDPVLRDGKPQAISTTVTLNFVLPGPVNPDDPQIAKRFYPLHFACIKALSSQADTAQQASACTEAALVAETFSTEERFVERRTAFVYASVALLNNRQFKESLDYANKAVAVVKQGHDDGDGSSSVYSALAQAEAGLGDLNAASRDLTTAEDFERQAITNMKTMNVELVKRAYVPQLKGLLNFHAQILSRLGKTEEAEAKTAEAAKL